MKRFFLLILSTVCLRAEPIDVIIPCVKKDLPVVEYAIKGIRMHCSDVRRVIVVSPEKLTESAEWFPESEYPFTKKDVNARMVGVPEGYWRAGWYYQQLLKCYVFRAIPDLADHVLLLDADTVFFHKVRFIDDKGRMLLCPGREYHKAYFRHMAKFLPGLKRMNQRLSGISNHMLINRGVMEDLFARVEEHNQKPFWHAFMDCVEPSSYKFSGASEYEIYFNFCLKFHPEKVRVRKLKWKNMRKLTGVDPSTNSIYDFGSFHSWMRER